MCRSIKELLPSTKVIHEEFWQERKNRVVEPVRTTQGNSTEIIPISLTWRDTLLISSKEIQVKESLVANITYILNKAINQTHHPKC
jgi:hypothetical protein